jgi:hypothetical protein
MTMIKGQHNYSGFIQTPQLWKGKLDGLEQLALDSFPEPKWHGAIHHNRLGRIAEDFTFEYWKQSGQIELLARNHQVQAEQETLGEIDAVLMYQDELLHVEIAYKIYLYDPDHGDSTLEHWIGPNRNDSLKKKLEHLKNQQIPLISSPEARSFLETLVPNATKIKSKVWWKAQLYVPLHSNIDVAPLEQDCIVGHYLSYEAFLTQNDSKFYVPKRVEWFSQPRTQVKWSSIMELQEIIQDYLKQHYSPMLWMKQANGELSKFFIVWWL